MMALYGVASQSAYPGFASNAYNPFKEEKE
jgi:hypothetical protein